MSASKEPKPLVGVAVAVEKADKLLERALASLRDQTHVDWRCAVVCPAPSIAVKKTLEDVARDDHRFTPVMPDERMSWADTMTRALDELGDCRLLAIQSPHGTSEPERLADQVRFLDENPGIKVCGTWFKLVDRGGKTSARQPLWNPIITRLDLTYRTPRLSLGTAMFRREVWEQVHGFVDGVASDIEWLERVEDAFPVSIAHREEFLVTERVQGDPDIDDPVRTAAIARLVGEAHMRRPELRPEHFPPGEIRLDLGAGPAPAYGYVHVDAMAQHDIEIVANVLEVPLPDESCAEVRASHLLEHLPFAAHVPMAREMWRLLRLGGEVNLIVPNLADACERLVKATDAEGQASAFPDIFGSEMNQYEFHVSGWTAETMVRWLESAGFEAIRLEEPGSEVRARARKG